MRGVSGIFRDLFAVFIDDEFLAVGVLSVLVVVLVSIEIGVPRLFGGGLLLVGCLVALALSVVRGSSTR